MKTQLNLPTFKKLLLLIQQCVVRASFYYTGHGIQCYHVIFKGPKLDALRSSNVTSANYQHNTICQDQLLFKVHSYLHCDI